ncbi:alcohol dehydrogenase superfamily protein [Favolaschia claudopus]|uniref:Alcohol dehydrogenase superfamily protein n=1 Tax=Favolaschia claudopus TaxID=2862362 RepID=A0AAV9ZIA6_9AGAR
MSLPVKTRQWFYPKHDSYRDLTLEEVPLPSTLGSNEVLVKIHAVSLQFRDLLVSKPNYSRPLPPHLIPCSDMAGEVLSIGQDVKAWNPGDRVAANLLLDKVDDEERTAEIAACVLGGPLNGVLTQFRVFPAHSLVAIPGHLSYEEASTLPCAALTAYVSLSPIKAGDTILVIGTGGVSIFALQLATASGASVILLSSSDAKLDFAKTLGAKPKHVINYKTTPKWDEEVQRLTKGVGVDLVVEVTGNTTLERSIASVRMGGHIAIVGHLASGPTVDLVLHAIRKSLTIRGIYVGSVKQFKAMNRLISANPEATRPVIDKVFSFEEVHAAYAHLEGQRHVGKVVIRVSGGGVILLL